MNWTKQDEQRAKTLRDATRTRKLSEAERAELSELRHRETVEATRLRQKLHRDTLTSR